MYATDELSRELEELQFTLGQGPGVDASGADGPVLVTDFMAAEARCRWPMFAPAVAERGVGAVYAFPVGAGAANVGVLDVYRSRAGSLDRQELADGLAYADAALMLALDHRGGVTSDLAYLIETGFVKHQAEVHQAAGMVAAQLNVPVTDALARLRAHAYMRERRLGDVAADVLVRRLRFGPGGDGELSRGDPPGDDDHPGSGGDDSRYEKEEEGGTAE